MRFDEVAGNDSVREELKVWALNWQRNQKQQPIILYGPSGVGKTTLAFAVAEEMGWSVFQSSTSDLRNAESIKAILGAASSNSSLFSTRRLIIVDEVEYLDRGGNVALQKILKESLQPIILIADDYWSVKLSSIRSLCYPLQLKKVGSVIVKDKLRQVARNESINVPEETIEKIAETANGDLRGALIDLRAGIVSDRERQLNVFDAVKQIFKTTSFKEAMEVNWQFDDLDFLVAWLEENAYLEYEKFEDFATSMHFLSRADIFKSRIRRRQNYSFLRYVAALGVGGVALSKREPYRKFVKYQFPSKIKNLAASAISRAMLKNIGLKLGEKLHCSLKQALPQIPFLQKSIGCFGFEENEVNLFKKFGK